MAQDPTHKRLWDTDHPNLPAIDLTLVQRESYQWFLEQGIRDLLSEVTPINDFTGKIGNCRLAIIFSADPALRLRLRLKKVLPMTCL